MTDVSEVKDILLDILTTGLLRIRSLGWGWHAGGLRQ